MIRTGVFLIGFRIGTELLAVFCRRYTDIFLEFLMEIINILVTDLL